MQVHVDFVHKSRCYRTASNELFQQTFVDPKFDEYNGRNRCGCDYKAGPDSHVQIIMLLIFLLVMETLLVMFINGLACGELVGLLKTWTHL